MKPFELRWWAESENKPLELQVRHLIQAGSYGGQLKYGEWESVPVVIEVPSGK